MAEDLHTARVSLHVVCIGYEPGPEPVLCALTTWDVMSAKSAGNLSPERAQSLVHYYRLLRRRWRAKQRLEIASKMTLKEVLSRGVQYRRERGDLARQLYLDRQTERRFADLQWLAESRLIDLRLAHKRWKKRYAWFYERRRDTCPPTSPRSTDSQP